MYGNVYRCLGSANGSRIRQGTSGDLDSFSSGRYIQTLVDAMGPVEAERFIALILREPFDYTQWRTDLWPDRSVEDISRSAMELRRKTRGPK